MWRSLKMEKEIDIYLFSFGFDASRASLLNVFLFVDSTMSLSNFSALSSVFDSVSFSKTHFFSGRCGVFWWTVPEPNHLDGLNERSIRGESKTSFLPNQITGSDESWKIFELSFFERIICLSKDNKKLITDFLPPLVFTSPSCFAGEKLSSHFPRRQQEI